MMMLKMQAGVYTNEFIDLLCQLTKLNENTVNAIKYHLVKGATVELSAAVHSIRVPNLIRSLNTLNEINYIVDQITITKASK